jgi:hypothetical protein
MGVEVGEKDDHVSAKAVFYNVVDYVSRREVSTLRLT